MSQQLALTTEEDGSRVLIRATGELDFATAEKLVAVLNNGASDKAEVVIDLRGLTFMDCAGLRVVLYANKWTALDGCRLRLIRGTDTVQRVFQLTGTEAELRFIDTDDLIEKGSHTPRPSVRQTQREPSS